MSPRRIQQLTARVLLVALAPWCAGCATEIYLERSRNAGGGSGDGRLDVRVYENRPDLRRDDVSKRTIVTELYRLESGSEKLVREERATRWAATGLAPGRYVLRVRKFVDETGAVRRPSHDQDKRFRIRANETATADIVLKDPRRGWIAAEVATVVVILVVLARSWSPLGNGSFFGGSLH
jgi:hypothetical protein